MSSSSDPIEVEQKFRISDPAIIRNSIRSLGGRLRYKGGEKNTLYDYGNRLRHKSSILRLRQMNGQGILTFKGPRLKSRFKKRLEVELLVKAPKMRSLLRRLGFREIARYQKYREEYTVSSKAHITLDQLQGKGWFVEIEAPADQIMKIASKLRLGKRDRENRSYLAIVHGNRNVWSSQ